MTNYDSSHYDPPAPVTRVTLREFQSGATISDVPLLLDTGADITLLPRTAIDRLCVPMVPDKQYEIMGFDGSTSSVPIVMLDMIFLKRTFRGRYLLIEGEWGILGRDILNHVTLLLNGPGQQWLEHSQ